MAALKVSTPAPGVAAILLDAPPINILGTEVLVELDEVLVELEGNGTRVVVIGSAIEGYFAAHGSLDEIVSFFSGEGVVGDVDAQRRAMWRLDSGPMVSIAAIDGQAWGGGAELAWACDLRVASEDATFAQPEVNIGVTPGWGGISKLAHLVGESTALHLALDGRPISGADAERLGLVHRLVPQRQAIAEAVSWARWLASRPEWALVANKRLVKETRTMTLRDALRKELEVFAECASDPRSMHLIREAVDRYRSGADSYGAFGLPSEG
jgi:enoyl-CoA hydratase